MPSFRHRARSHFRSYGLPVLAILAGNTYGLFLQRPCGNIDGSRIFERIQHRLCHRQLCVLYQFLFQRARQLTVSNDTQFDSDFPVSFSYWFSQIDSSSLFIMGFAPPLSTIVSLLICIWYLRYTKDKRSTTHPCYSQPS